MCETVIKHLAMATAALNNCRDNANEEMALKHTETILDLIEEYLPSGSGINSGVDFDYHSTADKIIMDFLWYPIENEQYAEAVKFQVLITPSLINGFNMEFRPFTNRGKKILGQVEEYLHAMFRDALEFDIETQAGPHRSWRKANNI